MKEHLDLKGRTAIEDQTNKTIVVFERPFTMPGFDETLPAGEYEIDREIFSPPDHRDPEAWKASVVVHLHPRASHPGLTRTLAVSLVDLDSARAKDKLSGKELSQVFLDEMLSDPMVRLVMQADGVSEVQLRHLYSELQTTQTDIDVLDSKSGIAAARGLSWDDQTIQDAENEGMPTCLATSSND